MVVLLEGSQRVHKDPCGLAMGHSMEEARWLIVYHSWGLLSFARSVGVMDLRVAGLEQEEGAVVAVAGVEQLADSDNDLA